MDNTSPLMRRTYAQPLTLELLAEHVPVVQRGVDAAQELIEVEKAYIADTQNRELKQQRNVLRREIRNSQKSQETLIISALPLIKDLASKEFSRRKAWSSRIPYDDILNEAIAGFIRGLQSYKPANTKNSATNYLGQWIVTTIRRKAEVMEHDFFIPYETVEKNRRIIAVRSRLSSELGRPPTDDEMLEALNTVDKPTNAKWGRNTGEEAPQQQRKTNRFTQEHLELANQLSNKLYSIASNEPTTDDEEGMYERSSTTLSASTPQSVESIEQRTIQQEKNTFFLNVFLEMRIGSRQKDIILRHFGMSPYHDEQTFKEIAEQTGQPTRFIKQTILAFSQYMPLPGGVFHKAILKLDEETVYDLELQWLLPLLGEWPTGLNVPHPPPSTLTTAR